MTWRDRDVTWNISVSQFTRRLYSRRLQTDRQTDRPRVLLYKRLIRQIVITVHHHHDIVTIVSLFGSEIVH